MKHKWTLKCSVFYHYIKIKKEMSLGITMLNSLNSSGIKSSCSVNTVYMWWYSYIAGWFQSKPLVERKGGEWREIPPSSKAVWILRGGPWPALPSWWFWWEKTQKIPGDLISSKQITVLEMNTFFIQFVIWEGMFKGKTFLISFLNHSEMCPSCLAGPLSHQFN